MLQAPMEREREAVDSEHEGRLNNDNVRLYAALDQLAKPNHPMSKFGCGNKKTLTLEDGDEEVYKKLHDFKNRHYSAQFMTLVIQSQQTLEDLEAMVRESFFDVPNNGLVKDTFEYPFTKDRFPCLLKAVPIEKKDQLRLSWNLPSLQSQFKSKPLVYLWHILTCDRKGGIKSYLKKKTWITDLSAYVSDDDTYSSFGVNLNLTDEGKSHIQDIMLATFSYLKLLQEEGPQEEVWNEMKDLNDIGFKFYVESDPLDIVIDLANEVPKYPPEYIITGPSLLFSYEPDLIQDCLDRINPDNVCMVLFSKDNSDDCQEQETWHKIKYCIEDIPLEWMTNWKNASILKEFSLPKKNKLIAENFDLKECGNVPKYPKKILDESYGELFYKYDNIFKQPKGHFKITVTIPKLKDNLTQLAADFILKCYSHYVKNEIDAGKAGLGWSIWCGHSNFNISVNGWNDKMSLLLAELLDFFKKFKKLFNEEVLQAVLEKHRKGIFNDIIDPDSLANNLNTYILKEYSWTYFEELEALPKITKEFLFQVYDELFKGPHYIQALVQGNFTQEEAIDVFNMIKQFFNVTESCPIPRRCLKKLPSRENKVLRVSGFNPKNCNTIVDNLYQFGPVNVDKNVCLTIANKLMKEPTFDTLRTKEQLGYNVSTSLAYTSGSMNLYMSVTTQATKFTADFVDQRIETFLKWFVNDKLQNLTNDEYKATVDSLIKSWSRPNLTLSEEVDLNWGQIYWQQYAFDIDEKNIAAATSCNKDKCIRQLTDLISPDNPERCKFSIQVIGSSETQDEDTSTDDIDENKNFQIKYHTDGDNFVSNIEEYRNSLEFYPYRNVTDEL
jgi:nardilysin